MIAIIPKIERSDENTLPHLSASQLKTYSMCSLKWQLSRRHKPNTVPVCLPFGRAFHAAVEFFYQARLEGRTAEKGKMLATFDVAFEGEETPVRYCKNETRESIDEQAEKMIEAFLEDVRPSKVIALEERFECHLTDGVPPLVGYIDLVEIRKDEEGIERLHLIDFKTAARKPGSAQDLDPDQITLYAIAAHRTGLLKQFNMPFVLEYIFVTKTKAPDVVHFTVTPNEDCALRLLAKAQVIWRGMSQGICYPTPGWQCSGCGYRTHCEDWKGEPT